MHFKFDNIEIEMYSLFINQPHTTITCTELHYSLHLVQRNTIFFFFSRRSRHTRFSRDWSSDVCSSDLTRSRRVAGGPAPGGRPELPPIVRRPAELRALVNAGRTGFRTSDPDPRIGIQHSMA